VTSTSGLQTSAQSLPGVIGGIASIVGNAGGGWIMQTYGSNALYRITSVMVLCSAALFYCFSAYHKSKETQKAAENSSQDLSSTECSTSISTRSEDTPSEKI
jgi:hypothetical protein